MCICVKKINISQSAKSYWVTLSHYGIRPSRQRISLEVFLSKQSHDHYHFVTKFPFKRACLQVNLSHFELPRYRDIMQVNDDDNFASPCFHVVGASLLPCQDRSGPELSGDLCNKDFGKCKLLTTPQTWPNWSSLNLKNWLNCRNDRQQKKEVWFAGFLQRVYGWRQRTVWLSGKYKHWASGDL